MSATQQWLEEAGKVLIGNYARQPVVMERGAGAWVWDTEGRRYLDLFAGFGGSILGHCHPELIGAAAAQAGQLWHVGNVFWNRPQADYAARINRHAFAGQAFFCHSGAEANEAACKLARLRGNQMSPRRWKIIALEHAFHGRTLAMLAANGTAKYRQGFEPVVPGFVHVPVGDFDALSKAIDPETAGIIMEPIQGEGGINTHPADYAARVRRLCDERGLTLIFDEVWTGCGRTGRWFGHQHLLDSSGAVVEPDIMTLGKAAGGGLPVGVMYARPQIARLLVPGTHGCTMGGNAICMAVASRIFDIMERDKLVEHAAALGDWAIDRLAREKRIAGRIAQVRGRGLFLGIELAAPPEKFLEKAMDRGVIVNVTAQKVVRLAPAMVITRQEWESGVETVIDLIAGL